MSVSKVGNSKIPSVLWDISIFMSVRPSEHSPSCLGSNTVEVSLGEGVLESIPTVLGGASFLLLSEDLPWSSGGKLTFFTNISCGQTHLFYSMIELSGKLGQMPQSCPTGLLGNTVLYIYHIPICQGTQTSFSHLNPSPSVLKFSLLIPFPGLTESSCSLSWYPKPGLGLQIATAPSSGSISTVDYLIFTFWQ